MASVVGMKSLFGTSDEDYNNICAPCKNAKTEKEGTYLCENCQEYFCEQCKNYHQKRTVTKHNKILSASEIQQFSMKSQKCKYIICCSCAQNQEVKIDWETDNEVSCTTCDSVKHRKCKVCTIQERSTNYAFLKKLI